MVLPSLEIAPDEFLFLQEIHSTVKDKVKWRKDFKSIVFNSKDKSNFCVVFICFTGSKKLSRPQQTSPTFPLTSRFCHVGWNVGMVCAITKFIKFRKRKKNLLDDDGTKFHPTCFNAKVWIFHVGLVWWGVSSNIHKFSLISNVCTFELQFEFLNLFSNFEFRFNHKHLLWMRKAQDHVLQLYYKIMYY